MHRTCLGVAILAGCSAVLSGCDSPLSTLTPAGPSAASIATLWWVMLAGAMALLLLVMAVFAMVIWRPGWGSNMAPARWIVLGGLALPAAVLLPLVGYALFAGEQLLPLPGSAPLRNEVVAQQWSWTFHYPEQGGVTTENVLHVPAGTPIDVLISSADVIHSFWVPQLAGKMDAVPGHVNRLRIQANEPGRYLGLCNEFCGQGHATMRFDVIAHPPEEYTAALAQAVRSQQATNP